MTDSKPCQTSDDLSGLRTRAVARTDVELDPSIRTVLDGAWRPRSRDAVTELMALAVALDGARVRVDLMMLNPDGWNDHPRRLEVARRTAWVAWSVDLDPALLIATTGTLRGAKTQGRWWLSSGNGLHGRAAGPLLMSLRPLYLPLRRTIEWLITATRAWASA
jgi:Family of unknown function (DUF5994)